MGFAIKHLMLPVPRSHTPSFAEMARLIERLVDERFVLPPGSPVAPHWSYDPDPTRAEHAAPTGCYIQFSSGDARWFPYLPSARELAAAADRDFKLIWPVESLEESGSRYPLTLAPEGLDPVDLYYDLEIHLVQNYIYNTSELITPFASEACAACGADLNVPGAALPARADFFSQLYRHCPACGVEFRPEDRTALVYPLRPRTHGRPVPGGATSRFAVAIDCDKCWEYEAAPTSEFRVACEEALHCRLEHVVDGG